MSHSVRASGWSIWKVPPTSLTTCPSGPVTMLRVSWSTSWRSSSAVPVSRTARPTWIGAGNSGIQNVSMPAPTMVPRLSWTSMYRQGMTQSTFNDRAAQSMPR